MQPTRITECPPMQPMPRKYQSSQAESPVVGTGSRESRREVWGEPGKAGPEHIILPAMKKGRREKGQQGKYLPPNARKMPSVWWQAGNVTSTTRSPSSTPLQNAVKKQVNKATVNKYQQFQTTLPITQRHPSLQRERERGDRGDDGE